MILFKIGVKRKKKAWVFFPDSFFRVEQNSELDIPLRIHFYELGLDKL
jgi:hypothetical protein